MKNKTSKFIGIVLMVFALFTGLSAKAAPPCPSIKNTLTCPITVLVEVYGCSPVAICHSYNVVVPVGATVPINCYGGTCSTWCAIKITVLTAGGAPVTPPITITIPTPPPGPTFNVPASCGTGPQANIYFDSVTNMFVIN